MHSRHIAYLLFAISLMTVGQLPAGIYLPAMTTMNKYFGSLHSDVQYVLGIYLFSYGASQLIYGPLSDHYGRKPTVIIGLIIFITGSFISAISTQLYMLYAGSCIQGIGLGSVAVISNAVVRDIYEKKKILSGASYMSAATIITPLIGLVLRIAR